MYPGVPVVLGPFAEDLLLDFTNVVVSPGISLDEPALVAAREKGVTLHGDVELFLEHADAPVIVITGSNGKSTVTQLVGEMAEASGLTVGVGGNLGTPMLDLLDVRNQLYVIELSSFQLELVSDTRGAIAALLNISPDHMDRYAGSAAVPCRQAPHLPRCQPGGDQSRGRADQAAVISVGR